MLASLVLNHLILSFKTQPPEFIPLHIVCKFVAIPMLDHVTQFNLAMKYFF